MRLFINSLLSANNNQQQTPVFLLIGGQSNTGTNGTAVSDQYPTGRVDYSLMPSELKGEQENQKIWNGIGWDNFNHPATDQYGWINNFLHTLNNEGYEPYIYKWGQGGNQLTPGHSPYTSYPRDTLKDNGLNAWNNFKTLHPDGDFVFLWCQGYTDALDLTNTDNYDTTLSNWFAEVRTHFSLPNMKIIFNGISDNATGATYRSTLKNKQIDVANESVNNIFVDADGMDFQDVAHFSNIGVIELSDAYFNKFNLFV